MHHRSHYRERILKMPGSMFDKMIRVDCSKNLAMPYEVPDEIKEYIGGIGYGTRIMVDEVFPGVDPLSEANKIIITVGPLTGTNAPLHPQTCIVTKTQLAGTILNCYTGWFLGAEIKFSGIDGIILEGISSEWKIIYIENGSFKGFSRIDGYAYAKKFYTRPVACYGCPVHCGMLCKFKKRDGSDSWLRGSEYETMFSLGSDLMIDDPVAIAEANQICEEYGMDTLTAGVTVAWALEAAETGSLKGTGLSLKFSGAASVLELLRIIGDRKGVGDLLAQGAGLSRSDDSLPDRCYEPVKGENSEGTVLSPEQFENMLDEYYETRGWTKGAELHPDPGSGRAGKILCRERFQGPEGRQGH
jgi:aldehyde:ferredoxin oxidoreductase